MSSGIISESTLHSDAESRLRRQCSTHVLAGQVHGVGIVLTVVISLEQVGVGVQSVSVEPRKKDRAEYRNDYGKETCQSTQHFAALLIGCKLRSHPDLGVGGLARRSSGVSMLLGSITAGCRRIPPCSLWLSENYR